MVVWITISPEVRSEEKNPSKMKKRLGGVNNE